MCDMDSSDSESEECIKPRLVSKHRPDFDSDDSSPSFTMTEDAVPTEVEVTTVDLPDEKPKAALTVKEFLARRAQTKAEFYNPELKKLCPTSQPRHFDLSKLEHPLTSKKVEDWICDPEAEAAMNGDDNTTDPISRPSDSDAEADDGQEDEEEPVMQRIKKKNMRLQFSDDEEDEVEDNNKTEDDEVEENVEADEDEVKENVKPDEDEVEENVKLEEDEVEENAKIEEVIDDVERGYDSEENEIVVPKRNSMVTKGLVSKRGKLRREFVENEAEFSGSEEGSGDEDERGLDELDEEEGDAEIFDEDAVRNQLEQQHIRKLIDDDDKQIRFLQNIFLEDGDLHGDGDPRSKQFKWKHIDKFDLDAILAGRNEEGGVTVIEDDEAERLWQEQKAEKARWLKENSQLSQESNSTEFEEGDSQTLFLKNSKYFKLGKSALKKIERSCSFNETSLLGPNSRTNGCLEVSSDSMPLTRSSYKTQTSSLFASLVDPNLKIKRGSFLARGTSGLTKIAEMTKSESNNTIKINSRNFVFSVVTPPGPETGDGKGKRKTLARHPSSRTELQARKMPRMDRSFDSLDAATKARSIFSQY